MKHNYRYGKPLLPKWLISISSPIFLLVIGLLIIIIPVIAIIVDLYLSNHNSASPTTKPIIAAADLGIKYYVNDYFQFADSGNWRFEKSQSTSNTFVYQKYLGNSHVVQHRLSVYINKKPEPLYLASPRVLPIKIENSNTFKPTEVSQPCGESYGPNDLRKIKSVSLNGASFLCDPELTEFRVVFSKIGGSYEIPLSRSNGTIAKYTIIYQNLTVNPGQLTIMAIANTFQAL